MHLLILTDRTGPYPVVIEEIEFTNKAAAKAAAIHWAAMDSVKAGRAGVKVIAK